VLWEERSEPAELSPSLALVKHSFVLRCDERRFADPAWKGEMRDYGIATNRPLLISLGHFSKTLPGDVVLHVVTCEQGVRET
jgi:hypothetical protein